MAIARSLRKIRLTLSAGVLTAVRPPAAFKKVLIGNGTGADLRVYTNDDQAQNEYTILATGYESLEEAEAMLGFRPNEDAFWLLSTPGGLVTLKWS